MRRLFTRSLLGLAVLALTAACAMGLRQVKLGGSNDLPPAGDRALRVATYNVHYIDLRAEEGPWSRAGWLRRRDALVTTFGALDADLVAFQEMESFAGGSLSRDNLALDWVSDQAPNYAAAAEGDPATFPSTQPILYRTDRLTLLDEGWFFFSETPEVIYSRGFDGASPSFASWARFADRGKDGAFILVNVHFDNGSWENRRRSALLVAGFVAKRIASGEPVILAGDLNALSGSRTMSILEDAGLRFPPVPSATFHFNRGLHLFGAIDHIGMTDASMPEAGPFVLRARYDGKFGSDHYPVALDLHPR